MLDRAQTFPIRNRQPVFEHLAGWRFRRTFRYFTARMTGKVYSPLSHLPSLMLIKDKNYRYQKCKCYMRYLSQKQMTLQNFWRIMKALAEHYFRNLGREHYHLTGSLL